MPLIGRPTVQFTRFVMTTVAIGGLLLLAACAAATSSGATSGPDVDVASVPTADPVEFDIELGDLWVKPERIDVPAGAPVVLHVTNVGQLPHDLKVNGEGTRILGSGESESVRVGPFTESALLICTVPGHRAAGMVFEVTVDGTAAQAER